MSFGTTQIKEDKEKKDNMKYQKIIRDLTGSNENLKNNNNGEEMLENQETDNNNNGEEMMENQEMEYNNNGEEMMENQEMEYNNK